MAQFNLTYESLGTSKIVAVMLFVIFFELGLGPITWLIGSEIYTVRTRGAATSIVSAINWICNFAVGMSYPTIQLALGGLSFVPFGIIIGLGFIFIYYFVVETKGKQLDEIQSDIAKLQNKLTCFN